MYTLWHPRQSFKQRVRVHHKKNHQVNISKATHPQSITHTLRVSHTHTLRVSHTPSEFHTHTPSEYHTGMRVRFDGQRVTLTIGSQAHGLDKWYISSAVSDLRVI